MNMILCMSQAPTAASADDGLCCRINSCPVSRQLLNGNTANYGLRQNGSNTHRAGRETRPPFLCRYTSSINKNFHTKKQAQSDVKLL